MNQREPGAAQPAVGWHGKLPTVGDFATRRLDGNFVSAWDDWLCAGLARLRADDPQHWLEAYLASPTWRFVLTPGFLPAPLHADSWTGVVMPSVDRVGRYYPLTLATPLRVVPAGADEQGMLWSWLQCLEDAAVDALQDDWSIDALETELLRLGPPPAPVPVPVPVAVVANEAAADPGRGQFAAAHGAAAPVSMESFFAAVASAPPGRGGQGRCVWYSEADISAPRLLCSTALDDSILRLWVDQRF